MRAREAKARLSPIAGQRHQCGYDDGVLTSNGSIVSYEAAIALLAKLTNDEFAAEVANDLQFKRVANAILPPRLHWKLAFIVAVAAFLFGASIAGLTLLIPTKRTKR